MKTNHILCLGFGLGITLATPLAAVFAADDPTIAETKQGPVRGVAQDGYVEFKGIPFAEPPVGELRFAAPAEPTVRSQELAATEFSNRCVQLEADAVVGNEDCLYLNVYRPEGSETSKLPVMFYIHGGGLLRGSANLADGRALATENNVILVTINYRINGFGFFAHPALTAAAPETPANLGLLDQRMAMKWVRENIASFGGDPENITIYGYSSGGISVIAHLASEGSAPMFDKAIALSGGWYPKGRTLAQAEVSGAADAAKWGCEGEDAAVIECLRAQPVEAIVKATTPPGEYEFVPIVDGKFMTSSPENAFASGNFNKVPYITSATQDEYSRYLFSLGEQTAESFAQGISDYLSPMADRKIPVEDIRKEYQLDQYPNPSQALSAAVTDFMIACQHLELADNYVKYAPDVWAFQFAATSNPAPAFEVPDWYGDIGNYHGIDHEHYFGNFSVPVSDEAKALAKDLRTYLANFARTGNPNGQGLPEWKTLSEAPGVLLNVKTPFDPAWDARTQHHCAFWEDYQLQL